jgi:hypothetical protein
MMPQNLSTKQKALSINLDSSKYGTFAEIGAGQEVARCFFQVGGASRTVAKSISAYDMIFSDEIYGREDSGRYVCESRVKKMFDYEYRLLEQRLSEKRGSDTSFFAFANTVATKSYGTKKNDAHGWMGVKFQTKPHERPSEAILHLNMLDSQNQFQQEALGMIGVNLLYACFNCTGDPKDFLESIFENLGIDRISIDMIKVNGPCFKNFENRLLNLELVKRGFCDAILFGENGEVLLPRENFYKKNILVVRGSYRPPTLVNQDILKTGEDTFLSDLKADDKNSTEEVFSVAEITTNNLNHVNFDGQDFLARVDLLAGVGQRVLVSNFAQFYKLNDYFSTLKAKSVALVLGGVNFKQLFEEDYYQGEIDIFGALGELFRNNLRVYVYPYKNSENDESIDLSNLEIPSSLKYLYEHLIHNRYLKAIENYDESILHIYSRKVLNLIQEGDRSWEQMVPEKVKKHILKKKLFGLK